MGTSCCWSSMIILILLIYGAEARRTRFNGVWSKCPMPRLCDWGCDPDKKAIYCSDSMLGPYSPDLPDVHTEDSVWSADFSYNSIITIQNMAFYATYYEVILFSSLDFSSNLIRTIEPEAFQGLESSLHTLNLNGNMLETIPSDAVRNLTKLHHLLVSGNRLLNIDFICSTSLTHLHTLDVSNNEITDISPTCLYGTRLGKTEGSELMLQGNKIRYIDACNFQGRNFQTLDYSNNSLVCMCDMSWLSSPDYTSQTDAECTVDNGTFTSFLNYTSAECEPLSINSFECVDMVLSATYNDDSSNGSEVKLNWYAQDFPNIAHVHATLYLFRDGGTSEIGRYKLRRSETEPHPIQLPTNPGADILVCLEATKKNTTQEFLAPLTAGNRSHPEEPLQPIKVRHRQCHTVKVPDKPAELRLGYLLNEASSRLPNWKVFSLLVIAFTYLSV